MHSRLIQRGMNGRHAIEIRRDFLSVDGFQISRRIVRWDILFWGIRLSHWQPKIDWIFSYLMYFLSLHIEQKTNSMYEIGRHFFILSWRKLRIWVLHADNNQSQSSAFCSLISVKILKNYNFKPSKSPGMSTQDSSWDCVEENSNFTCLKVKLAREWTLFELNLNDLFSKCHKFCCSVCRHRKYLAPNSETRRFHCFAESMRKSQHDLASFCHLLTHNIPQVSNFKKVYRRLSLLLSQAHFAQLLNKSRHLLANDLCLSKL